MNIGFALPCFQNLAFTGVESVNRTCLRFNAKEAFTTPGIKQHKGVEVLELVCEVAYFSSIGSYGVGA